MADALVSIVIPAYNPAGYLLEALASAAAQTHANTEIILVNDGSDRPESQAILGQAAKLAGTYLEQPNRGLGAARNAGFGAARGEYVVPLDADDRLENIYIAECLAVLRSSDAAFAYTDFQVFGTTRFEEHPGEYNLYRLLDRNYLSYAALMRKADWADAGGYDERMRGYEDWEFWLRLGARGRFGRYIPKPLFGYRKHGPSLYQEALAHHAELTEYIRSRHPELYQYQDRARVKARWSPAVSLVARQAPANQTILDIEVIAPGEQPRSRAVVDATDGALESEAAEMAALRSWSGQADHAAPAPDASAGSQWRRHLLNADLLSLRSWTHHPVRSLGRLIPLRSKERVNRLFGRPLFDLSFYLQFQPNSLLVEDAVIGPLVYYPKPAPGRTRVALVTTQLGPGGAEAVLYDFAAAFCSSRFESLLFATQSRDDRWLAKWRKRVDHLYDLALAAGPERMTAALCCAIANWRCDCLVLQNSLYAYSALPYIKKMLPQIRIFDVNHYIDADWDQIAATAGVAAQIDVRIALAESVRDRLIAAGAPESKVLLVRNGVDLERFRPSPKPDGAPRRILFAARLTARKRPLFLIDIARELGVLRPQRDFRFVIAGDGPEEERFRKRVHKEACEALFDFRGQVDDLAPLLASCDLLVHPSLSEGVPLVILEALASARPVVASKTGGIPEVLDASCGFLVEQLDSAAEFARAIHALLDQPALQAQMGAAGRRKVEAKHDLRETLATFAGLFDQGSPLSVSSTSRSTAIE